MKEIMEPFVVGLFLLVVICTTATLVIIGLKAVAREEAREREKVVNDVLKKLEERSIGGYITWTKR